MLNTYHTKLAIELAKKSSKNQEIPVGCVIFDENGKVISYASNATIEKFDSTAHAEILAIRKACELLKVNKLNSLSIYVTLKPCKMCEAAIFQSGIKKIFFGAYSNYSTFNDNVKKNAQFEKNGYQYYGGIEEIECSKILKSFFKRLR